MSTGDLRAFVLMSVMVKKWDLQLNEEISLVEWRNTTRDLKGMKSTKTKAPHCSNTLWTNYPLESDQLPSAQPMTTAGA
jgi:hypothetical protein